jgi:hypothetical protein
MNPYAINFLWINEKPDNNSRFICPLNDEKHLTQQFLKCILSWANANPLATTTLYYDSVFASKESPLRTQQVLESYKLNVHVKDIRSLPLVKVNSDTFSDQIPLYYRIDLLKWIILLYCLEQQGYSCAIFTDLLVKPMNPEELFNASTVKELSNFGVLLNQGPENQFLQLIQNQHMIHAIKHAIINNNLTRAEYALNYPSVQKKDDWKRKGLINNLSRTVFQSTVEDVFDYYQSLKTGLPIQVLMDNKCVNYLPEQHGYAIFGNSSYTSCGVVVSSYEKRKLFR